MASNFGIGFLFAGTEPKIIVTTSVDIAGSLKRSTTSRSLMNSFMGAGKDLNMTVLDGLDSNPESRSAIQVLSSSTDSGETRSQGRDPMFLLEEADSIPLAIAKAGRLILDLNGKRPGVIRIAGSLHAVTTTMSHLSTIK